MSSVGTAVVAGVALRNAASATDGASGSVDGKQDAAKASQAKPASAAAGSADVIGAMFDGDDKREKFIPVTRQAVMERLARSHYWSGSEAVHVRRFFRYLDYWRKQTYSARLLDLEQTYEPFSPDSDLLITRKFSAAERGHMQKRLVSQVEELLVQANYTQIDPDNVALIMTKDSHYGLDLFVDFKAFDELSIFYRGATKRKETRRNIKKLYLLKEEFDVPIFQRICILFKLKPEAQHVQDLIKEKGCSEEAATKLVRRLRSALPPQVKSDLVYLKLFKNMPRSDIEMVFPNTKVKFRLFDKFKLGVTAGSGLGMGVFGTAGKIAVATNPIALAGALVGLGGIAIRQAINFMNQKNKYMTTMAQNLYFHAMADNRGVMTLLADRAAEEDLKEEVLLYTVLAKEPVNRARLAEVDAAIEQYLLNTFGVNLNFDVEDALGRLMRDGIVTELPDGTLKTLPPAAAAVHIDVLWDKYLDELPDMTTTEGVEFELEPEGAA